MGKAIVVSALVMLAAPATSAFAADAFKMNGQVRDQVRAVRQVALAPDGKRVAAMITDTTADGGQPRLWLLAPGAPARQLTSDKAATGAGSPQWTADGNAILYLARSDGVASVFRLPLDGGEPARLSLDLKTSGVSGEWNGPKPGAAPSVKGFALSPDGKNLALWADDPETPAAKARKDRKDDAYIHHDDDDQDRTHLYMVDAATGAARKLALGGRFLSLRWSTDGADMIVTTDPQSDVTGPDASFWQMKPDGSSTRLDLPRTAGAAAVLPGRARIAFMDQCADDAPPRCNDLHVKDLKTGAEKNLTRGFDGSLPSDFIIDRNGDLVMSIASHMKQRLARISTKDGAPTWFDTEQPVVAAVATNGAQSAYALIAGGPDQPATVFHAIRLGGPIVKLDAPATVPADWPAVPSKLVKWQNEGLTIEGLLYMPPKASGKVPLVVIVHGGPTGRFADNYSNLVQMLAGEGWAVLQTNPRGSTGYGAKFAGANKNDLGGADYRDIMAGVDTVLKDFPIDPARTALIGYSYGGEMAGFVAGKTTRFKALVAGAPVINQFSEYGTEDGSWYDRWFYGKPWDHFQEAWRQSPLTTVSAAKTPFLLLQGEADRTDPLGQSIEMWRALRQVNVPVELVVYPREDHGPLGQNFSGNVSTEPWHGVDLRRRMFGVLRAAFAGEADPLAGARGEEPSPAS